ncbi:MAG: molybdopterin-binding protein [Oscillospiraceae bacterium]
MTYHAEIIAVGTELLLGNIANTDAQELSQALASVGVDVLYHTVVGDNPQRLEESDRHRPEAGGPADLHRWPWPHL